MHENGHNQGAVQRSAPFSTGAGHCWEDLDVMCYSPDGGDQHQDGTVLNCPADLYFDCGFDSYFDAAPEPGEWLAQHWNIAIPANRFIALGGAVDRTAPETAIDSGPSGPTADSTPTFGLVGNDLNAAFECRIGGAWENCSGPGAAHTSQPLGDGSYTLQVRARDLVANRDPSPALRSFTIDTIAPQAVITGGPSGATDDRTPSFRFATLNPEAGPLRFRCAVDARAFARCLSPRTIDRLASGRHSFRVIAADAAGNRDRSPATRRFRIRRRAS